MLDLSKIDLSRFRDIPTPVRFRDQKRLSISANGTMTLNGPFLAQLGDERGCHLQISDDGRLLLLRVQGDGNTQFSRRGVVTNTELRDLIGSYGYSIPARYVFEWYEREQAWVGCIEELPAPPTLHELIPQRRRRRKDAA